MEFFFYSTRGNNKIVKSLNMHTATIIVSTKYIFIVDKKYELCTNTHKKYSKNIRKGMNSLKQSLPLKLFCYSYIENKNDIMEI